MNSKSLTNIYDNWMFYVCHRLHIDNLIKKWMRWNAKGTIENNRFSEKRIMEKRVQIYMVSLKNPMEYSNPHWLGLYDGIGS